MEEAEEIQNMLGRFQTILNELRSLCKTFDNYDHIDEILRSLSRKWKPQVTMLRALNVEAMSSKIILMMPKNQELSKFQSFKNQDLRFKNQVSRLKIQESREDLINIITKKRFSKH